MRLICPPKDWRNPVEIPDVHATAVIAVLKEVAKRLDLAVNYDATTNKLYFGPAEQQHKLVFVAKLPLKAQANIIDGVIMLDGKEHKACSGAPGCQVLGQYFRPGAPIPPGSYELDLASYYCDTPGIEGQFYHILPDPIVAKDGSGKQRSEIGLHRDAGAVGTAGCIGVVGSDFGALHAALSKLAQERPTLPLEVSYLCRD